MLRSSMAVQLLMVICMHMCWAVFMFMHKHVLCPRITARAPVYTYVYMHVKYQWIMHMSFSTDTITTPELFGAG